MQDAFGKYVDFYPIHRSLLAITDDTKLFIIPGKIITHCKYNEMLVSSVHDNKTQMYYKKSCDDDYNKNSEGMRVKIAFTFTGEGQVFNPYVAVSGLTEIELQSNECPSGIIVVPVRGISMESNRYPNCQKNGYVVFMINTVPEESFHLNNHDPYHKEVYNSCMDYICKVMHGFDNDKK